MNKKLLLLVCLIGSFFIACPASSSEMNDYLDELSFMQLRIAAVGIDMDLYFGWGMDQKKKMKKAAAGAIEDLELIKTDLSKLQLPDTLTKIRELDLQLINSFQKLYNGAEKKTQKVIDSGFEEIEKIGTVQQEEWAKIIKEFQNTDREGLIHQTTQEANLIPDEKDRLVYLEAVKLLQTKKPEASVEAYKLLLPLKEKYVEPPARDCIMLRISDCFLINVDVGTPEIEFPHEEGLKILTELVDSGRYFPSLFETYYKWRTMEQEYNHGMSNMSEIPNQMYNQKRWAVVQTLKKHLLENPQDRWARIQIELMLSLDNIFRGTPYGNSNLVDWGHLYMDLSEVKA